MKILITGFDSFGGEKMNPSYESVKKLPDKILGWEVVKIEIPTVINKSMDKIVNNIKKIKPDVVICVGQAGGRSCITPEKIAININDFAIKDNEGNKVVGEKIQQEGDDGYFSTLPVNKIVEDLRKKGIPSDISYTAGTFVCNDVFYNLMYYVKNNKLNIRCGFIHIPFVFEQVVDKKNTSAMTLEMITRGLDSVIKTVIQNEKDIKSNLGTIC